MAAMLLTAITAFIILLNCGYHSTGAKLLAMHPLSARQVYRLLHESGRSDAIPQGRIITQGLAAMTGFALGLTKGLGGAFIYDIITANVTAADLESAANAENGSTSNRLTTQEVCFDSRSARSLAEAEAVAEAYSRDSNRNKDKRKVRPSAVERIVAPKRRDKRRRKLSLSKKRRRKRPNRLVLAKHVTGGGGRAGGEGNNESEKSTATGTQYNNPTIRAAAATATSATMGTIGTGTNEDNGQGTGTISTSTTSTGNDGAINCVVIQKPAVR